MKKNSIKLIRISSIVFLLSLILTACVTPPTSTPSNPDELENIRVQTTEAVITVFKTEEFALPNCEGTSELSQSLGTQTSIRKSVTIGSKASLSGGGEVGIAAAAKVKLEAAVEQAYQQTYETAVSRLDTIVMKAATGSHVVYVVQWDKQAFDSIVSYDVAEQTYQTPYTFVIYTPKLIPGYTVPCPTIDSSTDTPTPTAIVFASTPTGTQVPLRIISIQGDARIKDDESWPMNDEYGNLTIPLQSITLTPRTSHPLQFEKCVGGEVRLEIDLDVYLKEDLTAEIKIDARLYEGTSCSPDDQEDTVSQVVYARPDGSAIPWSYTLRNTENNGGDWATINLTFFSNTP